MTIRYDYNGALDSVAGKKHGLTLKSLQALQKRTNGIHKQLLKMRETGDKGFFDLPYDKALVGQVRKMAQRLRG